MQLKRNLGETCFITGYKMIDEKIGIGLIGISLNNSYFNNEIINKLIVTAKTLFKEIKIIIPDTPLFIILLLSAQILVKPTK